MDLGREFQRAFNCTDVKEVKFTGLGRKLNASFLREGVLKADQGHLGVSVG